MGVPRFVRYAGAGYVGQYIHLGGKIAVMVELAGVTPAISGREELTALVKEIAMQIAAANPSYATREAVPADLLEREKSIYRAQSAGKPANVIGDRGGSSGATTSGPGVDPRPGRRASGRLRRGEQHLGASVSVTRRARLKSASQPRVMADGSGRWLTLSQCRNTVSGSRTFDGPLAHSTREERLMADGYPLTTCH
jgi:hypothetical protein